MATFSRASEAPVPVDGVDGGSGPATVREVALDELRADWRALRFVSLDAGSSLGPKPLADHEAICFVISGSASVRLPSGRGVPCAAGSFVALPLGGALHVVNDGAEPARLLLAEVGGDDSSAPDGPGHAA